MVGRGPRSAARCTTAGGAVGTVRRMLALPSCEVLEVAREGGGGDLLVPLITDAVRAVDIERPRDRDRPGVPRRGLMLVDEY